MDRRRFLGCAALASLAGVPVWRPAFALEPGRPSRTALAAAAYRAAHQLVDDPRVFEDPFAVGLLKAGDEPALDASLARSHTRAARSMRAFIAMRSRYAEDRLAAALARGVRQYVVLGAGLDTFGCRNPHGGLAVFEVDFPATQAWKRERLDAAGIAVPGSLTFAPVDFERQTLADGLRAAGLRSGEPVFFSMLGVVIYLTHAAIMDTMRFAASCPAGSEIVFDFALPAGMLGDAERRAREAAAARVARIGEPWLSAFDPEALADELRAAGFSTAEALAPEAANERYFASRGDGLRLSGSGRMMAALT